MVICEVITGGKRTPLINVYLHTSTLEHLTYLEEDLISFRYHEPILLGDLNVGSQSQNPRSQQVADLLMKFCMVDLLLYLGSAGGFDA